MIKNRENKEVVEIEQTERPQQSAMRLEWNDLESTNQSELKMRKSVCAHKVKTDKVVFNVTLSSNPGEPKTFQKAMHGQNRHKWVPSAKEKINYFLSREAWKKFPREALKGCTPIPVKWMFKIKIEQDVQYTARALSVVSSSILQLLVSSTTIQWPCIVLGYTGRLVIQQYSVTIHHWSCTAVQPYKTGDYILVKWELVDNSWKLNESPRE
jgi:hypothetical protein